MTRLRVGTRGSTLARRQTAWVCKQLMAVDPSLIIDEIVITTHGDKHAAQHVPTGATLTHGDPEPAVVDPSAPPAPSAPPIGIFTTAIERALLDGRIDLAVHSHKDLPTEETAGLCIAAIPAREAAHDVLVGCSPIRLDALPADWRVGTGSPRRRAQLLRALAVEVVPIRGNVPTRLALLSGEAGDRFVDAVVVARAGLNRLAVRPEHAVELPIDRFVPAAAQGALAVQVRRDGPFRELAASIDHAATRLAVTAERALMSALGAGCRTAAGAYATVTGNTITLRGQLLTPDGAREANLTETGSDPQALGRNLAARLLGALEALE